MGTLDYLIVMLGLVFIADIIGDVFKSRSAYDGVFGHCCRFSSDSLRRDIFCNDILA